MKKCYTCKMEKSEALFHRDARTFDGLCGECKDCRNARTRVHHKKHYAESKHLHKASVKKYKNGRKQRFQEWKRTLSCILCGEPSSCCLDFHHVNPEEKEIAINKAVEHWSWDRIMKEINKCVVVCSNCHRKIHAGEITLVTPDESN